jgi:hypothetical protein
MQNARWRVKRRHKEGRRNTGAKWKGRSIFLKERVKRTLWRVFDKCCEAASGVGPWFLSYIEFLRATEV